MRKSIKTAIFACVFAVAFQITAFASFSWKVENAESSYVGTTNVTVTNTSGKKETEDAPIVKRGTVVTFTEAAASAPYISAFIAAKPLLSPGNKKRPVYVIVHRSDNFPCEII